MMTILSITLLLLEYCQSFKMTPYSCKLINAIIYHVINEKLLVELGLWLGHVSILFIFVVCLFNFDMYNIINK